MTTFTVSRKPPCYSFAENAEIKVPTAGSFVSKNGYCVGVEESVTEYLEGVQVHTFELELAKLDLACIKTLAAKNGFEKVPELLEAPSFFAHVLAPLFEG